MARDPSLPILPRVLAALVLSLGLNAFLGADDIRFSADSVSSSYALNREKTVLEGNARVTTTDYQISATRIEIVGPRQELLVARGRVLVLDRARNLAIQGDNLTYDREAETLKVQGRAQLEDFGNGIVIRSDRFEYRSQEDLAVINTGIRIYKDDISALAETATFRRAESVLELQGLPQVTKGRDRYQADVIRINTETDEISLLGAVQGQVRGQESTP